MKRTQSKEFRLFVRVTPETYNKVVEWSKRLGLTMSQFSNICVQAGMSAVIRAVAPEEAFSPDQMADILEAAHKKGIPLKVKDLEVGEV